MKVARCRFVKWEAAGVRCLAQDEEKVCLSYEDGVFELIAPESLECLGRVYGRRNAVAQAITFCKDKVVGATASGMLVDIDFRSGRLGTPRDSGGGAVWALQSIPAGVRAACDDGTARTFSTDLVYQNRIVVISGGRCVCLCDDFAGGDDGSIQSLSSQALTGPESNCIIWCLAKCSLMLISGDSKGRVRAWDSQARVLMYEFAKHEADVLTLASSSKTLFAAGVDSRIVRFEVGADGDLMVTGSHRAHASDVSGLGLVGNVLISASLADTKLCSYSASQFETSRPRRHFNYPRLFAMDQLCLVVATKSNVCEFWTCPPIECLARLEAPNNHNWQAVACSSRKMLAVSDCERTSYFHFNMHGHVLKHHIFRSSTLISLRHRLVMCHDDTLVVYNEDMDFTPLFEVNVHAPPRLLAVCPQRIAVDNLVYDVNTKQSFQVAFQHPIIELAFADPDTLCALSPKKIQAYSIAQANLLADRPLKQLNHPIGFDPDHPFRLIYSRTKLQLDDVVSTRYGPILAAAIQQDGNGDREYCLRIVELPLRNFSRPSHHPPPLKRARFGF